MTTMEEFELMNDSKYRMYVAAVDKALKNFEYTAEWADLISALGKLNKVLLSYIKFPVIPRRIKIGKRLAQCMHPALPSGVHLKALETYDIIFRCMGTNRLACELFIYSSGLFPLMSHAAMNIRPTLLTIYETHFVPLGDRLRPALSGFLSGILPGLDTGTDHFDRTNQLLEDVCEGVDPPYFYTCIWQCVANNSPVRLPAVTYVYAHYSKKLPMEDQLYLMGHDIGLMVSGLCAAVQDGSVLVQRVALDLLMVCFPMQNRQLLYADMVRLVTAALSTILRRDMSLNRRLYSWLLQVQPDGVEEEEDMSSSPHSIAYDLLNDAIKDILKKSSTLVPIDVKSYRLLTSLFEKPQIGPVILDGVLYDVFRTLYLSCLSVQKHKPSLRCVTFNGDPSSLHVTLDKEFVHKNCQELVKNANLLFNTLQSYYIWSYIERLYEDACKTSLRGRNQVCDIGSGPPNVLELCILTDFLLDIIPIETYAESTSNILPNLFVKIIANLSDYLQEFSSSEIEASLELCQKILGKIQPISLPEEEEVEERHIEKSKSDSKISEISSSDELRDRTYSNPFSKKRSPRNKSKKKSKSSSKLFDPKSDVSEDVKELTPAPQPSVGKFENKHLLRCLDYYKTFYFNLITIKVLPNTSISQTINNLTCDRESRVKHLKLLLDQRLLHQPRPFQPIKLQPHAPPLQSRINHAPNEYNQCMKQASNLLLDFCGFPNLVTSEPLPPPWLEALLVGCVDAPIDIQLTAITTLLEVFSLAKTPQGTVVIGGIVGQHHVTHVEDNTLIIEEISRILWTCLGHTHDQLQLMTCVTLLYQIHNTFDRLFVEHVIARFLSRDHVTANHVKQFCVLWHLGRELVVKLPAHKSSVRNFDKSLLKILDLLQQNRPTLQLLAQNFLSHALLHHDIPRVLNPLLVRLLAANTARVSIRHVNINGEIHESSDVDEPVEVNDKKIYAVSNVNGNVIYHSDQKLKSPKKRWFGGNRTKTASVIDMTSCLMEDTNQVVAKKNKDFKNYNHSLRNLIINPLNKEIYPNGVDGSYAKLSSDSSDSDDEPLRTLPKSRSFEQPKPLVQSWSYCISDNHLPAEFEISKSAEDFFNKTLELDIVQDILNEIIDNVCRKFEKKLHTFTLYPIHSHLCLYYEVFDLHQIIYTLQILHNCLQCNPLLFIKCCATKGVKDLAGHQVLHLLARHRKSLQGQGFYGDITQELGLYRGYMFLDVILSVCINYARTFFPSFDECINEEIGLNLKIQLQSLEILHLIIDTLVKMTDNKGFKSYIADLLIKCKLQKTLLHCLLTSVRTFDVDMTFAEDVLLYNQFQNTDSHIGEHVESFQTLLLKLIHSLIMLEYEVFPKPLVQSAEAAAAGGEHLNYSPTVLIPKQQIFLSAILSALRHRGMRGMHEKWLNMVTSCLPYLGDNLKQISISVIFQICNNIEDLAVSYTNSNLDQCELSSDYTISQLESLTILCHYCLLDASQNQNVPTPTTPSTSNPGEIFNNLVNVFFSPLSQDVNFGTKHNSDHYQSARKTILSHMPRIISSVAKLWQIVVGLETDHVSVYGNAKTVKQQLLEFLSPIAVHHGSSFLSAVAVAWFERRNPFSPKAVLPEPNSGQNNLVYLISAIRVIPLDNLVQTVTTVIKNPPPCEGLSLDICLEVAVLELFYCYMRNASATQLSEAWASLLALIKEVASLSPSAQFLLAAILHEMMIKCCPLEERKDQKDLQDVTAKLIDNVSQVCGSCLEQTTWLRKNLAVKEEEDVTPDTSTSLDYNATYSVQAQLALSEILAPILDISFGSSEKDKVNSILTSLMTNIVPYLRTHTTKNMASFHACSKLLSSLSSYQYTRKAWKKDVFDLLLDNSLFQMDLVSLKFWKVIVDNLMTHDNTTFRDLMSRVSMTQSGTLGIFSSREQEYEQKGQLLKRLAYVIFCSEIDQYAKYMPDIQEQLTTSLRINVPGIQAQVFMCFRVILIRMSPLHVTSLWPIIISEMLQVFLQIEQELSTDSEEFSSHIRLMTSLDASWSTNSSNGLHALGHPHWLRLQLATAKLLDLALLLPATTLPQFQMYRWAFVGDDLMRESTNQIPFMPHVIRIAELMDRKFDSQIDILPMKRNELLLTMNTIGALRDLHSFFKTLSSCSNRHRSECSRAASDNLFSDRQNDKKLDLILDRIDRVVEADFLDKIPR